MYVSTRRQNQQTSVCQRYSESKTQSISFSVLRISSLGKKLQQESIVPLLYGLNNSLQIDQPSDFQRETAKDSERKRLTMTNVEKRMLEKQTARILASNRAEGTVEDEQWETPRVVSTRNGLGVKDKPQFKRNRAKGPNPLSCMKKKKVNDTIPRGLNLNPKLNIKLVDKRKRTGESGLKKRTRKRSKKGKSGQEITE
ncbi:hypothetical protein F2Q70_00025118 [Brassica cretica]|uniref:UTP23 sensor motif region domain-containing protein n=1 Tax=Brassica cretica TaxID=69181 RepID=A0A8S9LCY2_BRACR|nr:hypothetical protein F2Q70_00025118 [Brassica cretica]